MWRDDRELSHELAAAGTSARQQMAVSLGWHIILACFGVAFPAMILGGTTLVISQVPSAVSAVKVDGVRSYARVRAGEERFLSAAPIFHIWGLSYATLVPLYFAAEIAFVLAMLGLLLVMPGHLSVSVVWLPVTPAREAVLVVELTTAARSCGAWCCAARPATWSARRQVSRLRPGPGSSR